MNMDKATKIRLLFVFAIVALSLLYVKPVNCEAYTSKSINKEIKKVSRQIKVLTKKYNKENKGFDSIGGTIINYNPFIVKGFLHNYYWVKKPNKLSSYATLTAGKVKNTGKTKVFYDGFSRYTCKVVIAKKTNAKLTSKISSLKKKLEKLKNTKRNLYFVSYTNVSLVKGGIWNVKREGYWLYRDAYKQKVTFSSSKNSVASVNKKTGVIKAKKYGYTTITVKANVSKKKLKIRVHVIPAYIKFSKNVYEVNAADRNKEGYIGVNYGSLHNNISIHIEDTSIVSSAVNTVDGVKFIYTGKPGQTKITAKIKEGVTATCVVKVTDFSENDIERSQITEAPGEHVHEMDIKRDKEYHWKQCHICNEIQDKEEHDWIFDEEESEESTVDKEGYNSYYCSVCGEEKVETVPKLQHQCYEYLSMIPRKEATCTHEGNIKYYKCSQCGKLYYDGYPLKEIKYANELVLVKKSHIYSTKWTSDENYHWKQCVNCGVVSVVSKQVHVWGGEKTVIEPTETRKGLVKYTCTICGREQEKEVSALGHMCVNHLTKIEPKEASCKEEGNDTYYTCKCGKWYSDDRAEKLILNHNDVIRDKLAHTYGDGWEHNENYHWKVCVICGTADMSDKQSHIWNDGEIIDEPTETETGTAKYTCIDCGEQQIREVDALGHMCVNHLTKIEAEEPSCKEEGNDEYYTCECGKWYLDDRADTEILNHNEVTREKLAHTYSDNWEHNENYHWKECVVCGATDISSKQNHTWNDGEIIDEPTETEKGIAKYTCTECGEEQEREVKALGHICANHLTKVEEKAATCKEEGNETYYVCECGKWYLNDKAETEVVQHDEVIRKKLSHTYGDWKCDKDYHWKECVICGTLDALNKQEHIWNLETVLIEPTETEKGAAEYICTVCGEKQVKELKALSHMCADYLTKVDEKYVTCDEEGNILYYKCECGKRYYDADAKQEILNDDDIVMDGGLFKIEEGKRNLIATWKELQEKGVITVTNMEVTKFNNEKSPVKDGAILIVSHQIKKIGNKAFEGCSSLASVEIPSGIEGIGSEAFRQCSGITSVKLPSAITSIENGTFSGCNSLINITLPMGITSIGNVAFYGCSSLEDIKIPSKVDNIGERAFEYCSSLTGIKIPSSVTSIKKGVFSECKKLKSITLPDKVTSIGSEAFSNCSMLTNIDLPSRITEIGTHAFSWCYKLSNVKIPDGVSKLEYGIFRGCSNLVKVDIPSKVNIIDAYAFEKCQNITSLRLPLGITSIGKKAFSGCTKLVSLQIPSGVTNIGDAAFEECGSLTNINIPSGVTQIGNNVFYGCSSITSLKLPTGITSIGDYAFYGCSNITSLKLSSEIISIGEYAFYDCSKLNDIELPIQLRDLGDYAFCGCSKITSIEVPAGVTRIGNAVFLACKALKNLQLPDGITKIGNEAFCYCNNLIKIEIPDKVTSIGTWAFQSCGSLTNLELVIPSKITQIGYQAFLGVPHVYYSGKAEGSPWGALAMN